jgi:hypothetical protein
MAWTPKAWVTSRNEPSAGTRHSMTQESVGAATVVCSPRVTLWGFPPAYAYSQMPPTAWKLPTRLGPTFR